MILVAPATVHAQLGSFANKVSNKVKSKVNQRVDNKVDNTIDKTLDKAEGKPQQPATNTSQNAEAATETTAAETKSQVQRFSKYDFIPGEQIIFYNNFEKEEIAELPVGWNTNGSGEVITLPQVQGKWLQLHKSFNYLTNNNKQFPENYTIEFDVVMQLKNNGWMFPTFSIGILSSGQEPTTANNFLKNYQQYASVFTELFPAAVKTSRATVTAHSDHKPWFNSEAKTLATLDQFYGMPIHVAIQVQKERFRLWVNEEKAFDIPKAIPVSYKMNQLMFKVSATNYAEEQYGMYISNIKIATGKPDARHKLLEEGKFSTNAILFDVNACTIKPESAAVLRDIAAILNENKEVRVKIVGHTDSDGNDGANLVLSQKRAAAVKQALVNEYGVMESSLETDGKGETKPITDNLLSEGKAANRRVEFIKL